MSILPVDNSALSPFGRFMEKIIFGIMGIVVLWFVSRVLFGWPPV